jgi:hypothetical protein
MQCAQCKFAVWERTKTDRLSPTGQGRCTWTKTFAVPPQSFRYPDGKMTIKNTNAIYRNERNHPCPVGQPLKG